MNTKHKDFSNRLIWAMKKQGYIASRSPSGICMKTLSELVEGSEQICRRYIRGEALPDYDKILKIAEKLEVSPGWLLFGETESKTQTQSIANVDEKLLHYILSKSQTLYFPEITEGEPYADFVLKLLKDIRNVETDPSNLFKIAEIAMGSIDFYQRKKKYGSHVAPE